MRPQQDNRIQGGYAIAFSSALVLSTTGVLVRYLTEAYHMPPMILAFWRNCFLTICLLLVLVILLAVGPSLLGFGLYNISLGRLPSSTANLIATAEPLFTALLAYLLLDELLGPSQLGGGLLILGGVLTLRLHERRRGAVAIRK